MKYLLNGFSKHNVSLMEGKVLIPRAGVLPVSDWIAGDDAIVEAKDRGWITIHDKDPRIDISPNPVITMENDNMKGSLTPPDVKPVVVEAKTTEPDIIPLAPAEATTTTATVAKPKKVKKEEVTDLGAFS